MSVVVAVRRGRDLVVAADTQVTFGYRTEYGISKIWQVEGGFIGFSGAVRYGDILRTNWTPPEMDTHKDKAAWIHTTLPESIKTCLSNFKLTPKINEVETNFPMQLLIARDDFIGVVHSDLCVSDYTERGMAAVGSGSDVALASMITLLDLKKSTEFMATRAVSVAEYLDLYCGGGKPLVAKRKLKVSR